MRRKFPEEQMAMDMEPGKSNGNEKGGRMTGIELIDKYTNYYYRQMKVDGYGIDREVIMSELGLVYAKVLDRKNKGYFKDKGTDNIATASFNTYCICGFRNQINTLKRQLIEQACESRVTVAFNDECFWDEDGIMADDAIIGKELKAKILAQFSGLRQAIAGELICPSQAIVDAIKRHKDACRIPENLLKGRSKGSLPKAIAEVYGIAEHKARYEITKVKKGVKTLLIN